MVLVALLFPLLLLAADYNQVLNPGDSITVTGNGDGILQVVQNGNSATLNFVANATTTPTNTAIPTTVIPTPTPTGVQQGIWLSQNEIMALPMSGSGWDNVKAKAFATWGTANLKDINSQHDVYTLAGALYYARTGDTVIRTKVANAIMSTLETENGGETLAPSRNIVSYVISADLINLAQYDTTKNNQYKVWLTNVRNENLGGRTIITTHTDRPNNWGTHAGATRVAIARYLGDTVDLAKAANVFKGFVGDRTAYAGFKYGELWWQSNPSLPVGINPKGATIQGHNVDGVLPDDQRRGCSFVWPPCKENYAWEALQGAVVQAQLLHRAGYDSWNWSDKALLRAVTWLNITNQYPPNGDDVYITWIINKAYGSTFTTVSPVGIGKNMSFTDFTHK